MKRAANKRKTLSVTKQSESVQKGIREYQEYWRKAKGSGSPEVVRVTADQLKKLGVDSGFYFEGSKLELINA
jgi:hypothetical protein